MIIDVLLVFAGGMAGALGRGLLDAALNPRRSTDIGWAILICNVVGSLLLGLFTGWLVGHPGWLRLCGTGFCGALTTFSTFSVHVVRQLEGRAYRNAAVYAVLSLGGGVAAAGWGLLMSGAIG